MSRIIVAKVGLDGHDRGAKVVARALRDGGHEVIYTGLRQSPESIAAAAIDEDAICVAVSIHSGAHVALLSSLRSELDALNGQDVVLLAGGIIPPADDPVLEDIGVAAVFRPGTDTREIVRWVDSNVPQHDGS